MLRLRNDDVRYTFLAEVLHRSTAARCHQSDIAGDPLNGGPDLRRQPDIKG